MKRPAEDLEELDPPPAKVYGVKKHKRQGGDGKKYLICAIIRGKKQICQLSESCVFVSSARKCQEIAESMAECLNEGAKSESSVIKALEALKKGDADAQELLTWG